MTQVASTNDPTEGSGYAATSAWLETALEQALLAQEARLSEDALNGLFGEQCLQFTKDRALLIHGWTSERRFSMQSISDMRVRCNTFAIAFALLSS